MRAVALDEFGDPDVLYTCDLPEPEPGPDDLLVKVHASSMNPVDTKIRRNGLGMERSFPLVTGYDVSGVVEAVGENVDRFSVGDEIYGSPSLARNGAHAEKVLIDAQTAAAKPESLDHSEAAALPLVTLTAWEALHDRAQIHEGETVLIHAGAGGVGHIGIQLAKLHGCTVYTTASRDESIE
ncbi:MAG: alcohol dehydrogenase catalytic domain-containing protein, partial [Phycisphaeraceae bacterium]|nr:alcohol dehydrogenase catalytic domain-containing protein [Phycisphaeraceae bacterium]